MSRFISIALFLLVQTLGAHAQIDVLHYNYQLQLTDASDTLQGTAIVQIKILENTNQFYLNLASVKNGKGMTVSAVKASGTTVSYTHANDTLFITSPQGFQKDRIEEFTILYAGIPADGLIISKSKWNERTFFGDNWPDRAHQWIPCNDNPADKATVAFEVTAPAQYKVISNGLLVDEKLLSNNQKLTRWNEKNPVPTKVMVIGAARFAVKQFGDNSITPVSAWVYQQDSSKGFYDYALAVPILKFFNSYIGPFPFEKLANVQSKTIFGGMENASCIFYDERTVTGTQQSEALLAHEIAHQWFGNSATEKSFAHLWLSEGFATYFTQLYLEQKYGRDTLLKRLQQDRKKVISFSKQWSNAIVDSTSALMDLLNANSYEKGGWVLHMLRKEVGDSVFQKIIRAYYDRYKFSNAGTPDFEKVAEEISGADLKWFFNQWLYRPGIPQLSFRKTVIKEGIKITITQVQKDLYQLTMPVAIKPSNALGKTTRLKLSGRTTVMIIKTKTAAIMFDPDGTLLYEEVN